MDLLSANAGRPIRLRLWSRSEASFRDVWRNLSSGCPPSISRRRPLTRPEKASRRTLMGKCFCGAVQYVVPDAFLYAMNCHCSNCRRTTGSAFKPFAGIERDKLSVTKGRDGLLVFGDESRNDPHCE